jgi:hypothetical protein
VANNSIQPEPLPSISISIFLVLFPCLCFECCLPFSSFAPRLISSKCQPLRSKPLSLLIPTSLALALPQLAPPKPTPPASYLTQPTPELLPSESNHIITTTTTTTTNHHPHAILSFEPHQPPTQRSVDDTPSRLFYSFGLSRLPLYHCNIIPSYIKRATVANPTLAVNSLPLHATLQLWPSRELTRS